MTEIVDVDLPQNSKDQLEAWLKGKPYHNHESGECCPDFSCCQPVLLAPLHEREAFVRLDEKGRMPMLMTFLERALKHAAKLAGKDPDIHVIGPEPKGSA